jgi:diguanylate cyclase (GGDEF)-like protein
MLARLPITMAKRLLQPTFLMALLMLTGFLGAWFLIHQASEQTDARYRQLSVGLVDRIIQSQREQLSSQLADYSVWNDLYQTVQSPVLNRTWLSNNFNETLYHALKIQIGEILDHDGKVLYEIHNGAILDRPDQALPLTSTEWKRLRRVVERYDPYGKDGYPTSLMRAVAPAAPGALSTARRYMVAVQKIVPERGHPLHSPLARYVLFAKELDATFLNSLVKSYGIRNLHWCAHPNGPNPFLKLAGDNPEALGYLCWEQTLPGEPLLSTLLPRVALLLALLCPLAFLILRRAQRIDLRQRDISRRLASQGKTLRELVAHRHEQHNDTDDYLTTLAEGIAATLQVERVSLWRYSDEQQILECFITIDINDDTSLQGERLSVAAHQDYFHALHDQRYLASEHAQTDPRLASLSGYLRRYRIGAMLDASIRFGVHHHGLLCVESRNNSRQWQQDEINFVCSAADVAALVLESGARLKAEGELYRQFYYDRFTGLPNRARLLMQLDDLFAQSKGRPFGCLLIALEGLANINTLYGREYGDLLIGALCERLERFLNPGEMVARPADNRFCVVVLGDSETSIAERTKSLFEALSFPVRVAGQNHPPHLRGGLVVYPQDLDSAHESHQLLELAELALQSMRNQAGNGWARFQTHMSEEWHRRHQLLRDLQEAVGLGQLQLYYQPYLDTAHGTVRGAEALLRWQHPYRGFLSPGEFIPLAEETGLIVQLGDWALTTACTQAVQWRAAGHSQFTISVNVSLIQLDHERFCERVREVLEQSGLPANALELEVTETLALSHSSTIDRNVNALRALGVRLAIDDFGTGYASFSYLRRFPVEKLKIDREFLEFVPDNQQSANLVRMIVAMGHALGAQVTGEGVETERQLAFLAEIGCELAQGYYLSRPLGTEAMEVFLAKAGSDTALNA